MVNLGPASTPSQDDRAYIIHHVPRGKENTVCPHRMQFIQSLRRCRPNTNGTALLWSTFELPVDRRVVREEGNILNMTKILAATHHPALSLCTVSWKRMTSRVKFKSFEPFANWQFLKKATVLTFCAPGRTFPLRRGLVGWAKFRNALNRTAFFIDAVH